MISIFFCFYQVDGRSKGLYPKSRMQETIFQPMLLLMHWNHIKDILQFINTNFFINATIYAKNKSCVLDTILSEDSSYQLLQILGCRQNFESPPDSNWPKVRNQLKEDWSTIDLTLFEGCTFWNIRWKISTLSFKPKLRILYTREIYMEM